jgi:hypothetical protein
MRDDEILREYNAMYRPEPTPITHPELFDPLNPPAGWTYDAWNCIWFKTPTIEQYRAQLAVMWVGVIITVVWVLWMVFNHG